MILLISTIMAASIVVALAVAFFFTMWMIRNWQRSERIEKIKKDREIRRLGDW